MSEITARPSVGLADAYRSVLTRRLLWLFVAAGAVVTALVINIAVGPSNMGLATVLNGLIAPEELGASQRIILWEVRLPFALMALGIGFCLGLAGAELQTVLDNPLASPSTLGVMFAATLGASIAILYPDDPLGIPENYHVAAYAFIGAVASVLLIQMLSGLFGAGKDTVILFGIALVFALQALIALMQFVADGNSLQQIVFWTMGSLSRATWDKVTMVFIVLALCVPWCVRHVWKMTALKAGEDYAASFGIAVGRLRLEVLFRVSLLTAIAVAFTGVIGFVGLVAPHISRMVFGEDHRFYLPGSALAGAFIMSGAAVVSKSLIPGILVPDGIVTALIGIPLFLLLVIRRRGGRA